MKIKKKGFRDIEIKAGKDFVIKDEEEIYWEDDVIRAVEQEIIAYKKILKLKEAILEMAKQKLKDFQDKKEAKK